MTNAQINVAIYHVTGKNLDYVGCLNAMHEAEKELTDKQRLQFWATLCQVTNAHEIGKEGKCFSFVGAHATAAQRAEAFLRTLNLWEEDEK